MKIKVILLAAVIMLSLCAGISAQDGRYVEKEITYTVNPDSTFSKQYHHRLRYDSNNTCRRMGESFVLYNPKFQKLEAVTSATTMADGTVVKAQDNARNPVLPRQAHMHPGFSHLREMVVTHLGLERGAVNDFSYRLSSSADFQPAFAMREFIAQRLPVDSLQITIIIPAHMDLHWGCSENAELKMQQKGNTKIYQLKMKNIPAWSPGSHGPLFVRPVLVAGTSDSWKPFFKGLGEKVEPGKAVAAAVKNMLKECHSDVEKISAVQTWLNRQTSDCHVGPELSGWKWRMPGQVYAANSATEIEKTLLARSALNLAGFSADILAVPYTGFFAKAPPLQQISHFLIRVSNGSLQDMYISAVHPLKGLYPYKDEGKKVFNTTKMDFEILKRENPQENLISVKGSIDLKEKEQQARLSVQISGAFVDHSAAVKNTAAFAGKILKRLLPVGKIKIEKLNVLGLNKVSAVVTGAVTLLQEKRPGLREIKKISVPWIPGYAVATLKRNQPLVLDFPFEIQVKITVNGKLPAGYVAKNRCIENACGTHVSQVTRTDVEKLDIAYRFKLNKNTIQSREYGQLRDLCLPLFSNTPLLLIRD